MAFIDTSIPYASGNVSAQVGGAPSGGGNFSAGLGVPGGTPPGLHGPGGSGQLNHWVLVFYGIIAFVLVSTGVLFNGKGKK